MKAVRTCCSAETQNVRHRHTMEDAHVAYDGFGGDDSCAYFGVYDGHGGKRNSLSH